MLESISRFLQPGTLQVAADVGFAFQDNFAQAKPSWCLRMALKGPSLRTEDWSGAAGSMRELQNRPALPSSVVGCFEHPSDAALDGQFYSE
jgi:hypothetical protein